MAKSSKTIQMAAVAIVAIVAVAAIGFVLLGNGADNRTALGAGEDQGSWNADNRHFCRLPPL